MASGEALRLSHISRARFFAASQNALDRLRCFSGSLPMRKGWREQDPSRISPSQFRAPPLIPPTQSRHLARIAASGVKGAPSAAVPMRRGHRGHCEVGQSRTSWRESPQHHRHFRRIARRGVILLMALLRGFAVCGTGMFNEGQHVRGTPTSDALGELDRLGKASIANASPPC